MYIQFRLYTFTSFRPAYCASILLERIALNCCWLARSHLYTARHIARSRICAMYARRMYHIQIYVYMQRERALRSIRSSSDVSGAYSTICINLVSIVKMVHLQIGFVTRNARRHTINAGDVFACRVLSPRGSNILKYRCILVYMNITWATVEHLATRNCILKTQRIRCT